MVTLLELNDEVNDEEQLVNVEVNHEGKKVFVDVDDCIYNDYLIYFKKSKSMYGGGLLFLTNKQIVKLNKHNNI